MSGHAWKFFPNRVLNGVEVLLLLGTLASNNIEALIRQLQIQILIEEPHLVVADLHMAIFLWYKSTQLNSPRI